VSEPPHDVMTLDHATSSDPLTSDMPRATPAYRRWILFVLVLVATFNTMDRQILAQRRCSCSF
jgi:hypothetical protein